MKILVLTVSKKDTLYSDAISEYKKRLRKYVEIETEMLPHSDLKLETEKL